MDNGFTLKSKEINFHRSQPKNSSLLSVTWQKDRACLENQWKYLSAETIFGKKKAFKLAIISLLLKEEKHKITLKVFTFFNLAW
jgi:hypothetical protein